MSSVGTAINPSAQHAFSSPPLPVGYPFGYSGSGEHAQDEWLFPIHNRPNVRLLGLEEGQIQRDANTPLSSSITPPNEAEPLIREQKLLLANRFPVKLYFMLEDETVQRHARWTKTEHGDAILIPDIKRFVADVMPKHFKEMKKWGSFQKQLNNYEFERKDRGSDKAIYTHSKFCRGRPELLRDIRRRPNGKITARPEQQRPSKAVTPTPDRTTPEPGSPTDPTSHQDQIEGLKLTILKLRSDLECSEKQRSEMNVRLRAAEEDIQETRRQFQEMKNQLTGILEALGEKPIRGGALNSVDDPGPAQPVHNVDASLDLLNIPTPADNGALISHTDPLQSISLDSHLAMGMAFGLVDPLFDLDFLAL